MSSLFGALDTAVSGLSSQSAAFSNISDNVANSQTTGFKGTDTNFADFLTNSTASINDSGFVAGRPGYRNDVQGTIASSDNALALAISGNGFFQVSQKTGDASGTTQLSSEPEYTRDGNFSLDTNGYLVNDTGAVLNGWSADPVTGLISQNQVAPIKVPQQTFSPVATANVTLTANLPATPAASQPVTSQVNVYDAKGTIHSVSLTWKQNAADDWTVAVSSADAATPAIGGAEVKFGSASGNAVPAGTIGSVGSATGAVTTSAYAANGPASLTFTADFGGGPQPITVALGSYGRPSGLTQYAGTQYSLGGISQDGIPPGSFSGVTVQSSGNVLATYNNGQSRVIARVPLVSFAAPELAAAAERAGFHRHLGLRRGTDRQRRVWWRRVARDERARGLQRRYRYRIQQADRGTAGLLRQHEGGHHGKRAAAAHDRHEAVTA